MTTRTGFDGRFRVFEIPFSIEITGLENDHLWKLSETENPCLDVYKGKLFVLYLQHHQGHFLCSHCNYLQHIQFHHWPLVINQLAAKLSLNLNFLMKITIRFFFSGTLSTWKLCCYEL